MEVVIVVKGWRNRPLYKTLASLEYTIYVTHLSRVVGSRQLAKKPSNKKLAIKLAEHSGTGLVVVEGGVEKDANTVAEMIETIQVRTRDGCMYSRTRGIK